MPELPEVEVVRRGLERWVARPHRRRRRGAAPACRAPAPRGRPTTSRTGSRGIASVRPVRRGQVPVAAARGQRAVACWRHLGMSGQLLVQPHERRRREAPAHPRPLRRRPRPPSCASSTSAPSAGSRCTTTPPTGCPTSSPTSRATRSTRSSTTTAFHQALRRQPYDRQAGPARPVADQRRRQHLRGRGALALPRCTTNGRPRRFTRPRTAELLGHVRDVMNAALAVGGTSFDSLYVNVNGESGYFDRSLDAYGREDEPCRRCGDADAPSPLDEPLQLLLPEVPAGAASFAVDGRGCYRRGARVSSYFSRAASTESMRPSTKWMSASRRSATSRPSGVSS